MSWIPVLMVLVGACLISGSLPVARRICGLDKSAGWRVLFGLLVFFVAGYLLFMVLLANAPYDKTSIVVSLIMLGGGGFVFLVMRMTFTSISDTHLIAKIESHNALHDALTGLPNRSHLKQFLQQQLQSQLPLAVMVIDLDRFKEINDTLGHSIGDLVLQKVSQRFASSLSDGHLLARLGGDEFALVLPGASTQEAVDLARQLRLSVEEVIDVEEFSLTVGMSLGIALFPDHARDDHNLVKLADIAMYQAKRSQQDFMLYDESMDNYSLRRLQLVPKLKAAILDEAFSLAYQPIVNARSGKVEAFEALVRWPDLEGRAVPPSEFIPLAEETSVIKGITNLVIRLAVQQLALWHKNEPGLRVCVNLSALDLQDVHFPARVQNWLQHYRLPAELLTFEITESAMMQDVQQVKKVLLELGAMGAGIAVDDFGTGYSSLSLLRELPTQYIKMDRSFVSHMDSREEDAAMVKATVQLAHNIGRKLVAEGVETRAVREQLVFMGCDSIQGYWISKPMTADKVNGWLPGYRASLIAG